MRRIRSRWSVPVHAVRRRGADRRGRDGACPRLAFGRRRDRDERSTTRIGYSQFLSPVAYPRRGGNITLTVLQLVCLIGNEAWLLKRVMQMEATEFLASFALVLLLSGCASFQVGSQFQAGRQALLRNNPEQALAYFQR